MNYEHYLCYFSGAGFDIGLAPLLDDVFHRSKTNNKFREYGASHIVGIYSNVDVYSTCVQHGQTGYLVENTHDAWYDALSLLIENRDMRLKIQAQAYEFVRTAYTQDAFVKLWYQQIVQSLGAPKTERSSIELDKQFAAGYTGENRSALVVRYFSFFIRGLMTLTKGGGIVVLENYIKTYWVLWKIRLQLLFNLKK